MPDPYVVKGLAIINPYGGVWCAQVFKTPQEAADYLHNFWRSMPIKLSEFKLAPATLTITVDRPVGEPDYLPVPKPEHL